MPITSLLDHTARIWRRTETKDDFGGMVPSYSVSSEGVPCANDGQSSVLAPGGPGIVVSGDRWLFFDSGVDVQERDLVELVTGPTAPDWLEVESHDHFRGHHTEVRVSEFQGTPPEEGS